MLARLGYLSSAAVLSLMIGACENQQLSGEASPVKYSDPSMYLSDAEIIENYSNVSCESLRGLIDYLDQIGSTDYFRGLSGVIRYQPQSDRAENGAWLNLDQFASEEAIEVPSKLYLTKLDVPTRAFTLGFPKLNGEMIQNEEGENLLEYFSINFRSGLQLGLADEDGWYEFALLSDDGARMTLEETGENYIDNPDHHPTRMLCGQRAIYLKKGEALPININYFQGPKHHIALMLLWRKAVNMEDAGHDIACGEQGNSKFFDSTQNPPVPQAEFLGLVERGWEVVPAHVYRIPEDEYMNPCESDHVQEVIQENLNGVGE